MYNKFIKCFDVRSDIACCHLDKSEAVWSEENCQGIHYNETYDNTDYILLMN